MVCVKVVMLTNSFHFWKTPRSWTRFPFFRDFVGAPKECSLALRYYPPPLGRILVLGGGEIVLVTFYYDKYNENQSRKSFQFSSIIIKHRIGNNHRHR